MKTIAQLAKTALAIQDACNLSAVVHELAGAVKELWEYARMSNQGTDWVNRHPITRAYISKLVSLSRYYVGDSTFQELFVLANKVKDG